MNSKSLKYFNKCNPLQEHILPLDCKAIHQILLFALVFKLQYVQKIYFIQPQMSD